MSPSKEILLALLLGIALGLFFGERLAFLSLFGTAFVQLLQVTVLPYVAGSLIYGFGSLGAREARLVFSRGGALLALLWARTLGFVFLSPLASPRARAAASSAPRPRRPSAPSTG